MNTSIFNRYDNRIESAPTRGTLEQFQEFASKQIEYHNRTLGFLATSGKVLAQNSEYMANSKWTSSEDGGVVTDMELAVYHIAKAMEYVEAADARLAGYTQADLESGILL